MREPFPDHLGVITIASVASLGGPQVLVTFAEDGNPTERVFEINRGDDFQIDGAPILDKIDNEPGTMSIDMSDDIDPGNAWETAEPWLPFTADGIVFELHSDGTVT